MLEIIKIPRILNIFLAISFLNILPIFAMDEIEDYTEIKKNSLQNAILEGDLPGLLILLDEDRPFYVDVIIQENYLHLAVMMEAYECLSYMLKIKKVRQYINQKDSSGRTALHYAVISLSIDNVKLLLYGGANPESKDDSGNSSFAYAKNIDNKQLKGLMISKFLEASNNK